MAGVSTRGPVKRGTGVRMLVVPVGTHHGPAKPGRWVGGGRGGGCAGRRHRSSGGCWCVGGGAPRQAVLEVGADLWPFVTQNRVHGCVSPGAIGATLGMAQDPFRRRTDGLDGVAGTGVVHVGLELDAFEAVVEGGLQEGELDVGVERRAPQPRGIGGPAYMCGAVLEMEVGHRRRADHLVLVVLASEAHGIDVGEVPAQIAGDVPLPPLVVGLIRRWPAAPASSEDLGMPDGGMEGGQVRRGQRTQQGNAAGQNLLGCGTGGGHRASMSIPEQRGVES